MKRHFLFGLASLLITCCLLTGCGGGNIAPTPIPSTRTGDGVTEIVVRPEDAQAITARSIVLSRLPLGFLPGGKRVTMTTYPKPLAETIYQKRNGVPLGDTAGWYQKRENGGDPAIVFVGDGWGTWLTHMAIHEWAHFVQLDNCTEVEFAAWRVAYNSARSRGALPTEYSKGNEYEGWAEAVTQIYTGGALDGELRIVVDQVLARMTADRDRSRSQQVRASSAEGFTGCALPR